MREVIKAKNIFDEDNRGIILGIECIGIILCVEVCMETLDSLDNQLTVQGEKVRNIYVNMEIMLLVDYLGMG